MWVADGCIFELVELVYCGLVPAWHEMPVGIDGNLDAVVSHLLFDIGQRFAIL